MPLTKVTPNNLHTTVQTMVTTMVNENAVDSADVNTLFDTRLATKTTSNIAEGSNLYYTDARADARVSLIVDAAPSTLNTLNELAAALGDDANFSTTVTNSIATKLPLAGGTLTGSLDVNSFQRILANNTLFFMNTNNSASSYIKNTLGAGASDLRLGVMGDDKVTILSNGNVGIGNTTSPQSSLNIAGNNTAVFAGSDALYDKDHNAFVKIENYSETNNVEAGIVLRAKATGAGVHAMYVKHRGTGTTYQGDLRFRSRNTGTTSQDNMTITYDGKVGIGTTSPLAQLEIDPPAVDTPIFAIRRQDSTTIPLFKFFQDSSVAQGTGHAHMNTGNRDLSITADTSSTKSLGIYLKTTGQVGIGTVSPDAKLEVSGNVKLGSAAHSSWTDSVDDVGGLDVFVGSGSHAFTVWDDNSQSTPRFIVERAGNVGIGTASPADKLTITGGHLNITSTGYGIKLPGAINSDGQINFHNASSSKTLLTFPLSTQTIRLKGQSSLLHFQSDGTGTPEIISMHVNGNVGINDTNPQARFVVQGDNTTMGTARFQPDSNKGGSVSHVHYGTTGDWYIRSANPAGSVVLQDATSATGFVRIGQTSVNYPGNGNSSTGISLTNSGRISASFNGDHVFNRNSDGILMSWRRSGAEYGSVSISNSSGTTYNTTSDRRLKDNIQPISDATDKLMNMKPVTHTWIDNPDEPQVHGFVAQEMQEVVPEAVTGDAESDKMMSMDYGRITPVIVAALQDALNEIKELKTRIDELENK